MIFADKLIQLRKKAGWSQEELASQLDVTRVSTDYLLKDNMEEGGPVPPSNDAPSVRRVSMEEANAFLSVKARTAKTIAYAAFLCVLSPIALFLLSAISESTAGALKEDLAAGIGMQKHNLHWRAADLDNRLRTS